MGEHNGVMELWVSYRSQVVLAPKFINYVFAEHLSARPAGSTYDSLVG
jgi:hypothetical protein